MKCRLVIFVSSVLRRFGPGPSSVEFKYVRIVARFAYAMKKNKNKNKKQLDREMRRWANYRNRK